MEKYGAGSIVVSDYDPNWPTLFEQERTRIKNALGSFALAIEHMGSTAVPGLPSKPIIDLLVGVPSLEEARERCIEPIEALGWRRPLFDFEVGDRFEFSRLRCVSGGSERKRR
jgi:GrpB-like predicted nucleotidyltransferase (UPF0157 family)